MVFVIYRTEKKGDVIIVDDDSPQQEEAGVEQSAADFNALKELLDQEEKKLKQLKSQRVRQTSPINNAASATRAGNGPTIQGSALNKATGRTANAVGTMRESTAPLKSTSQSKPSIVVVPGNPASRGSASSTVTTASKSSAVHSTGISSRLQQIVDTVAVNQALGSISSSSAHNALHSLNSSAQVRLLSSMATPPVPSLITTSSSTQKLSNGSYHQLSTSNMPPLRPKLPSGARPSHEIITIGDSSVTKNPPPPLLPTPSSGLTGSSSSVRVPTATASGSIQVPAISSISRNLTMGGISRGQLDTIEAVENSKRYREFRMKQLHSKKTFQKQMERKMVSSPYPKTFRQVWPVVPIQDPAFIRNFGLEAVLHHFDSGLKALHEKTSNASKVKPICNQCGCDFASAWQIRKNNSKQLLLCEACDFQNLKILQRTKLSNQLKDLVEAVEKEEDKFNKQNEESLRQVIALEKQSILASQGHKHPPPLTSTIQAKHHGTNHSVIQASDTSGVRQSMLGAIVGGSAGHVTNTSSKIQMSGGLLSADMTTQPRAVIPSIIGQLSHQSHGTGGGAESGRKRKDLPSTSGGSAPPPSKSLRAGSMLDQTLNKLSRQLIHRKLDEQRQELVGDGSGRGGEEAEIRRDASPSPVPGGVATPTTAKIVTESRKSRRKGTPRHKRHLSSSSVTSE